MVNIAHRKRSLFRNTLEWMLLAPVSLLPVAAARGAGPAPLSIANSGFESPAVGRGDRVATIDRWIKDKAAGSGSGVIDDSTPGINAARQGRQWLFLNQGRSVGTPIGLTSGAVFRQDGADRLFVGFDVATIQNDEDNQIQLSVSLVATNSTTTWEGGALISSKQIRDLTNDNRADPNSYVDGYAILPLNQAAARVAGSHYWVVIRNELQDAPGTGMATIDQIVVNVASPPPRRTVHDPHILVVFEDDLGYGDPSFLNPDSKIPTPNLDRLASQGMAFMDAHSTATICGPSRVALLTGTVPDKLGVHGNSPNGHFGPPGVDYNTQSIADLCQSAGYDTAVVGKWGIASYWNDRVRDGVKEKVTAANAPQILDFSKPVENADRFGFAYRFIHDELRPFIKGETAPFDGDATPYGWHENGFAVREALAHNAHDLHKYYLRAITNKAVRYIQTKAGLRTTAEHDFRLGQPADAQASPFFLHYLTHAPHTPLVPAEQFRGASQAGKYGDFVVNLDYALGRLMRVLDEAGLAEDTLVVFSSDNGPEAKAYHRILDERHASMGILRGVKRDLYEGGHRVPLVVRWPRVVEPGVVNNAMVSLCDWFATFAAITRQTPPDTSGLDSMNLLPLLTGKAREVRGLMLQDTAIGPNLRAIRCGPWMYIDAESGAISQEPSWFADGRDVADAPGNELYNLAANITENRNLIQSHSDRAATMRALFAANWPVGVRSTPSFQAQGDTDGDGYSDFFEDVHGLDKHDPDDAGADADHDGLTTAQEALAGSDPRRPDTDGNAVPDGKEKFWLRGLPPAPAHSISEAVRTFNAANESSKQGPDNKRARKKKRQPKSK